MRNIRYVGTKPSEDAFFDKTQIVWTPGKVDTVLDEAVAAEMLTHAEFEDAGDASAPPSGAEQAILLTPSGLTKGGAALTAGERAIVADGLLLGGASFGVVIPLTVDESGLAGSQAFDTSIAEIGVGGKIVLLRGATYIVDRKIKLLRGQTLDLNGATIKRAAQTSTTTVTPLTSGVTASIVVANHAAFRVGQEVIAVNGGSYSTSASKITDISGSTVSVSPAFALTASGTTTIYVCYDLIETAEGGRVQNGFIDGNKANWTYARWQVVSEIAAFGSGVRLSDLFLFDSPGEGIQEKGGSRITTTTTTIVSGTTNSVVVADASEFSIGDYVSAYQGSNLDKLHRRITGIAGATLTFASAFDFSATGTTIIQRVSKNNRFYRCSVVRSNGNGIHLSASQSTRIEQPELSFNNLDTNIGHADGGISFSNGVHGAVIETPEITDNALCAIGGYDSIDNGGLTIRGGTIRDCVKAFEGIIPNGAGLDWLLIDGTTFIDAGLVEVNQTNSGSVDWGKRIRIRSPRLIRSRISFNKVTDFDIDAPSVDLTGDTSNICIALTGSCKRGAIRGGELTGGANGVYVGGVDSDALWIGGGIRLTEQTQRGVSHDADTAGQVTIDGAIVRSTVGGGYFGIVTRGNGAAINCDVSITGTTSGAGILQAANNSIAQGNTIRTTGGAYTIRNYGGSTGNILAYNRTRNITGASDGLNNGGGAGNTNVGNILLAT